MPYDTDVYGNRRTVRPALSTYTHTRRKAPEHLTPTMLRLSEVPPLFTAYGRAPRASADESGLTSAYSPPRRTLRSVAPDMPSHLYTFYRYCRH